MVFCHPICLVRTWSPCGKNLSNFRKTVKKFQTRNWKYSGKHGSFLSLQLFDSVWSLSIISTFKQTSWSWPWNANPPQFWTFHEILHFLRTQYIIWDYVFFFGATFNPQVIERWTILISRCRNILKWTVSGPGRIIDINSTEKSRFFIPRPIEYICPPCKQQ